MRRFFTKRRSVVALVAVAALAIAGGAFAYFTGTGSGTGSGSVGGATNGITVVGTETGSLYPGGPGQTVSFKASNKDNYNQRLSSIKLTSITPDSAHPTCSTVVGSDFSMSDVSVGSLDGDLAPNAAGAALTETGTLKMLDNGDQTACEGATLTLNFTTS